MVQRVVGRIAISLCVVAALSADSWSGATITETFSQNRDWFVRVTPGSSVGDTTGFAGSPKGPHATAEWFHRQADGSYRIDARATLANPVAPVKTLVSDRGYLVALDNWHNVGYGPAVAAYRPDGSRVVALLLADLYSKEEVAAFPHSVSSIWWRSDTVYVREGERSVYVAGRQPGHELILEPETGRWQICEPRDSGHQCRTANAPRTWGPYREP